MPTLTQYRRFCARELGPYDQGTADNTSSASALISLAHPFKSSIASGTFKDRWVFRPTAALPADQLRVVETYTASSGTLDPDLDWTNAPDGETFEVHGVIPPVGDSELSLHNMINDALKRLPLDIEFTVTVVADQTRHSLASAASWLTDPKWVRQVGYLINGEDRDEVDPFSRVVRGWAGKDGNTVYLNHPGRVFNATVGSPDVIYVRAVKPAYFHCADTLTPTVFTASGLSDEGDVAVPEEEWVAAAVLVEAWRRLGKALEAGAKAGNVRDRAEAAMWLTRKTAENFVLPELTFRGLRQFGPSRG